jgi:hypothetical protein
MEARVERLSRSYHAYFLWLCETLKDLTLAGAGEVASGVFQLEVSLALVGVTNVLPGLIPILIAIVF